MNGERLKCATVGCDAAHIEPRPAREGEHLTLSDGKPLPTLIWECVCGWKRSMWQKAHIPSPET